MVVLADNPPLSVMVQVCTKVPVFAIVPVPSGESEVLESKLPFTPDVASEPEHVQGNASPVETLVEVHVEVGLGAVVSRVILSVLFNLILLRESFMYILIVRFAASLAPVRLILFVLQYPEVPPELLIGTEWLYCPLTLIQQ